MSIPKPLGMALMCLALLVAGGGGLAAKEAGPHAGLRAAVFDVDVTPPPGMVMAYGTAIRQWDLGLRAKGMVLLGAGEPIVLCAVDWIGIGNEGHDAFREALANAVNTTPERVAVHALHQHDAPACDFSAERLLKAHNLDAGRYEGAFAREAIDRTAGAAKRSLEQARPVTHAGVGAAEVYEVASNRRIYGPDGMVRAMRFTACADPELRAEPEGTIDPMISLVSLWDGSTPIAVLSYYAVHPQSYYRTNTANPDFPGVARFLRQLAVPEALHIHFTGAAGNTGAGKYNDGAPENRLVLAKRLADGMKRAWEATERFPLDAGQVRWRVEKTALPPAAHLSRGALQHTLEAGGPDAPVHSAARKLAWLERASAGHLIDISSLELGPARMLHLPGELFVEYQLAAKAMRPDLFVTMAAYGDYAMGYIGTAAAYAEGGYETSDAASNVAPESEAVILDAISKLLNP